MNVIKRHKGLALILFLTLILAGILFAIFARMLFSTGKGEYGDRLNGVEAVSDNELKEIKESIFKSEEVEDAKVRIQGRIIYMTIYVKAGVSRDTAKAIANRVLGDYSEEILKDYDLEFLVHENATVNEEGEDTSYTIAGTKHPSKDYISWTK